MPRNNKLELENVGPRKWITADGRFGVVQMLKPIPPGYYTTEVYKRKVEYVYTIRDLAEFDGPENFYELAPEIGRVDKFSQVFPWLGKYTGEGSFDTEDVEKTTPKNGTVKQVREWREDLLKTGD